ncbi:MAG: hypothetical protein IT447_12760 [Phycisphaerales bacterium]|jgi:hypothetical protein|nr:hypothetical protein [Phycisphaerales bacterium]
MNELKRKLRHDIRGRINALNLCVAALETPMKPAEAEEFLADIIQVCDSMVDLMEQLERQIVTPAPSAASAEPAGR